MKKKILAAGGAVAAVGVAGAFSSAFADWCADDPAIQIGNQTVYVTQYAPDAMYADELAAATYQVRVLNLGPAQLVTIAVNNPKVDDQTGKPYEVIDVVSTGPNGTGKVLARSHGSSSWPTVLIFKLGLVNGHGDEQTGTQN
jgi:hypothetical protein